MYFIFKQNYKFKKKKRLLNKIVYNYHIKILELFKFNTILTEKKWLKINKNDKKSFDLNLNTFQTYKL